MLRRIIRDFRQLHFALKHFYLRRAHRRTPEQEVEASLRRLTREQMFRWRR
jgi:hypothetical protein